jgi:multiple sugar transport system permease protein
MAERQTVTTATSGLPSSAYVGNEPDEQGDTRLESLPVSFEMLLLAPSIVTLAVLSIVPLAVVLWLSVMEVNFTPVNEQIFVGVENYLEMVDDPSVWNAWQATVVYVGGSLALQLGLGVLIAVMLHRVVKGENVLTSIVIMPMMIAPVVVGLLWQFLLDPSFGLYTYLLNQIGLFVNQPVLGDPNSAMAALILMDTWQWTPLIVLIVLARLKGIPEHLYEAARVDGATGFTQFRYVTLPLLKPRRSSSRPAADRRTRRRSLACTSTNSPFDSSTSDTARRSGCSCSSSRF